MRHRLALAVLVGLLLGPAAARAAPNLIVGLDDDTLKWMSRPDGVIDAQRDLGVDTTRITIPWRRGELRARPVSQTYLSRAAKAIVLGQRIVLAVYGHAWESPDDDESRHQYCSFLRHVLRRIPSVEDVVVWNEANSPRFWRGGPEQYEALLAHCWDVLHGLRPTVNVISSTAAHYDPGGFLRALAEVYRRSGRRRRLVDTFGHNPYPENSAEAPSAVHPSWSALGQGDYGTLMTTLSQAFAFTAQPLPSSEHPSLWYLEDGFQTVVPERIAHLYKGRETDPFALAPLGSLGGPYAPSQGDQLRAAVRLAYCQPAVGAFFNFELLDEHRLAGWQSGLLWRDGTRKPSYDVFKETVADVHEQSIDCSQVPGAPPQR